MGGEAEGPALASKKQDFSDRGPGGARFVYLEDISLEPKEEGTALLTRAPGPGEAGFNWQEQKNTIPGEGEKPSRQKTDRKKEKK